MKRYVVAAVCLMGGVMVQAMSTRGLPTPDGMKLYKQFNSEMLAILNNDRLLWCKIDLPFEQAKWMLQCVDQKNVVTISTARTYLRSLLTKLQIYDRDAETATRQPIQACSAIVVKFLNTLNGGAK